MKKALLFFIIFPLYLWAQPLKISVEYSVHSLPAFVAFKKGLYEKNGLKVKRIDSYITGVALVSAMTKGDVDVAYLCLAPAVLAFFKCRIEDQNCGSDSPLWFFGLGKP